MAGTLAVEHEAPSPHGGIEVVAPPDAPAEPTVVVAESENGHEAQHAEAVAVVAAPLPRAYLAIKYPLSRAVAAVALVALVPVFAAVALAVRHTFGKGVLYRQTRVGRNGEDFVILKFRTMAADRRVAAAAVAVDRRVTHKSDDDPRHHPLGRLLRKTSLDELPQLWNVVKGEMTLVGPRPELSDVADRYGFRDHARHRVLPGITGLWQVSEHRADLLHEHIEIDTSYVERVSPMLDLKIIGESLRLLVRPTGR